MEGLRLLNFVNTEILLSEEDKERILLLEADIRKKEGEIYLLEVGLNIILLDILRKDGVIAEKLEDLKSKNGAPFVEITDMGMIYRYRNARSGNFRDLSAEAAYYCESNFERIARQTKDFSWGSYHGCGWVKGSPREEKYNEISFMTGAEGVRFHCCLCGKMLTDFKISMS